MKYFLYLILYLNIYTIISDGLHSQILYLEITAEIDISEGLKDTLNFRSEFPNLKQLQSETDSLSFKFQKLGYIESELVELQRKNDSVFAASYQLGNRWEEIRIHYSPQDFSISELKNISEEVEDDYFMLPLPQVEFALEYLNSLLTERGDPFAKIQLVNIERLDSKVLTADLKSTQNNFRTIDKIVIKGYEKFPVSFLKYYSELNKGKIFNRKKVIEQNDLLNNLGFVKTIKTPEALFRKDTTELYLYLEKRNNNLFDGILGFATNEETNKIEFNGYLNLELNNNLNFGEQLLVNYKSDGREQQNFRVRTVMPYIFKSPFGVSLELKIFKRDSTFSTTDQQAKIHYQVNPNSNVYVGYKSYESSNLLDEVLVGVVEDYKSRYLLAGASFTKLQAQNFFPVKTRLSIDSEIGSREKMGAKEDQFRLLGNVRHIFNLNDRNSIYLNTEGSILSSDTYLVNELFRFGGINSIRGFSENSIDASLYTVLNTEYRFIIGPTTYVHSIIDFAYFENQVLTLKEELYSFGFGFGLQTDAGIFRLNIANGISNEQNFKFSNTKIHLSLSSRF
ncbi:MAG: BamA/TamA family outer membrane protein [Flavobacteriaceae bacterium]|nr:BamA/TamA family outer membrane protein [Flavobacteriaceae bacterium]